MQGHRDITDGAFVCSGYYGMCRQSCVSTQRHLQTTVDDKLSVVHSEWDSLPKNKRGRSVVGRASAISCVHAQTTRQDESLDAMQGDYTLLPRAVPFPVAYRLSGR